MLTTLLPSFVDLFQIALPLTRLTRQARQFPKHPLLRSAILYFLACTGTGTESFSPATRRMVIRMSEQNISIITPNRPEVAAVECLLIMSLAPPRANDKAIGLLEPHNAGALALEAAKKLGLDDSMRTVLHERDGKGLDQWDTTTGLNRLCLASAILNDRQYRTPSS